MPIPAPPEVQWTADQAAEYLGFSRGYVYDLVQAKKIPHWKPNGRHVRFDPRELELWVAKRMVRVGK